MKVLLVHNKYRKFSGEEAMAESTGRILTKYGHDVKYFYRDSSSVVGFQQKILAGFRSFYSASTLSDFRDEVLRFKPDIVQVQNVYPLISPNIFPLLRNLNVPVVVRADNYRIFCPTGLMLRSGRICEKCATHSHLNCILHNCEKDIVKSFAYGLRSEYSRLNNFFLKDQSAFIVLSDFQKSKFIEWGVAEDKIHVITNPLPHSFGQHVGSISRGEYVAYVGRLSEEKGMALIRDAAVICPEIKFKLAGHSPDGYFESLKFPCNVEYLGLLDKETLKSFYSSSRFIVMPSQWYETFGLTAIEAMSYGKPVVASTIGALQEVVVDGFNGLHFRHNSVDDFVGAIQMLWKDERYLEALQKNCAKDVRSRFSESVFYGNLIRCYESVLSNDSRLN